MGTYQVSIYIIHLLHRHTLALRVRGCVEPKIVTI